MKNKKPIIMIAGGGTGGHIYPGIAIARAIQKLDSSVEIHFVGTPSGLESKIVPRENFKLHLINVGKLNYGGGVLSKIKTILALPFAFTKSIALLWQYKPIAVLGVGGYASGPFVLMSALLGFKTAIWEPNAYPGLTNRWLSRFVDECFVVFKESQKFFNAKKITQVGLPVREQLENLPTLERDDKFHILVFGGSQGARAINNVIRESTEKKSKWLEGTHLIHQTGVHDFLNIQESYKKVDFKNSDFKNTTVEVFEYLYDMDKLYSWADLVICRAGASTVAEIAACKKPAIFIPLPTAADDHQRKNAEVLAKENAALILLQDELSVDSLEIAILKIKNSKDLQQEMKTRVSGFYVPRAAMTIGEHLLKDEDGE